MSVSGDSSECTWAHGGCPNGPECLSCRRLDDLIAERAAGASEGYQWSIEAVAELRDEFTAQFGADADRHTVNVLNAAIARIAANRASSGLPLVADGLARDVDVHTLLTVGAQIRVPGRVTFLLEEAREESRATEQDRVLEVVQAMMDEYDANTALADASSRERHVLDALADLMARIREPRVESDGA